MAKGAVKWFKDSKGFGFITPAEGDRVEFEMGEGPKGPAAENVVRLK